MASLRTRLLVSVLLLAAAGLIALAAVTYAEQRSLLERRDASGAVLGHVLITYGQRAPATPKIPASVPVGRLFTVGSYGSSGLRYRAYVTRDREDTGLTVAALPLRDIDQTLHRLLLVEGLVI